MMVVDKSFTNSRLPGITIGLAKLRIDGPYTRESDAGGVGLEIGVGDAAFLRRWEMLLVWGQHFENSFQ